MKAIPVTVYVVNGQGRRNVQALVVPDKYYHIAKQLTAVGYTITQETLRTGEMSVCIEGKEYDEECVVGTDAMAMILQILDKAQQRGIGGVIRTERGLIWRGAEMLVCPVADKLAREWNCTCAEDLVKFLEGLEG